MSIVRASSDQSLSAPCRIDFGPNSEEKERESIPVYLRIKPTDDDELSIKVIDSTTVETNHAGRSNKKATFTHIFSGPATQQEVYDVTTAPLVDKFLDGANVMTFAYGVTSSGKTYTIMGDKTNPGVIPRTLEKIFGSYRSKIANSVPAYKPVMFDGVQALSAAEVDELEGVKNVLLTKRKGSSTEFDQYAFSDSTRELSDSSLSAHDRRAESCSVWISVYEIYNEVISDLLDVGAGKAKRRGLVIGQDGKGRTYVKDLTQVPVSSAAEAFGLLQAAKQNLVKAATKLNDCSSRSHMVFTVKMVHWGAMLATPLTSQLVISDLAGSERQAKTGTTGVILRQASAINNSLLVLGRCLEALRKKDKGISAPFRDSKLTRMLNPFFTLGGYVSLIICIHPGVHLQDETIDTIRFSAIASEVVQAPERPLDRLRQLRRLTRGCAENSPLRMGPPADENGVEDEVDTWKNAVRCKTVRQGVSYIEVQVSYFNDMARDILRAEKMLLANEEEISRLKARLKDEEASKENIRFMYQDRIKEQREKFLEQKAELRAVHEELKETLVEELSDEIKTFKDKYMKYRDGYAKVSEYLKEKLWPELNLFRERFGYLPEFPSNQGTAADNDDERNNNNNIDGQERSNSPSENSVRYWQHQLQEKEDELRELKRTLAQERQRVVQLQDKLAETERLRATAEGDTASLKQALAAQIALAEERQEKLRTLSAELADKETLIDRVRELEESLRQIEEAREELAASTGVRIHTLQEQLEMARVEIREKDCYLEDARDKEEETVRRIEAMKTTILQLEEQLDDSSSHGGSFLHQTNAEKTLLYDRVAELEANLRDARKAATAWQTEQLALQDRVDQLAIREKELAMREAEEAARRRELRKSRINDEKAESALEDLRILREELNEQREALAEKNILVLAQEAELDELRDKAATVEVLASQLQKLSDENRQIRDRMRSLESEKARLEDEVKRTRSLEVEVEYLSHKIESQTRRVLRECPQTEKATRARRRSRSVSDMENFKPKSTPKTERPRRRLWRQGVDDSTVLDRTLDGTIRDPSPLPTPNRNRAHRNK